MHLLGTFPCDSTPQLLPQLVSEVALPCAHSSHRRFGSYLNTATPHPDQLFQRPQEAQPSLSIDHRPKHLGALDRPRGGVCSTSGSSARRQQAESSWWVLTGLEEAEAEAEAAEAGAAAATSDQRQRQRGPQTQTQTAPRACACGACACGAPNVIGDKKAGSPSGYFTEYRSSALLIMKFDSSVLAARCEWRMGPRAEKKNAVWSVVGSAKCSAAPCSSKLCSCAVAVPWLCRVACCQVLRCVRCARCTALQAQDCRPVVKSKNAVLIPTASPECG
jgi:hypothetical protein